MVLSGMTSIGQALGATKAKRRVSNWASSCRVVGGE